MSYLGISNQMNILPNIGLYRGEYKNFSIDVEDMDGLPVNLSSATVELKIVDMQDEEIVYVEKRGSVVGVSNGASNIQLDSSDTSTLPMSKYVYCIEITYGTGDKSIGKGYLTIL